MDTKVNRQKKNSKATFYSNTNLLNIIFHGDKAVISDPKRDAWEENRNVLSIRYAKGVIKIPDTSDGNLTEKFESPNIFTIGKSMYPYTGSL